MPGTLKEFPKATIGNLNIVLNEFDELVVTGVYKGTPISQTIPARPPFMLFIDNSNSSIQIVPIDASYLSPVLELVQVVKEIS